MDKLEQQRRKSIVIEQCGGILPTHEAFYIQSIIYAADRAMDAFSRFDNAVANSSSHALIMATVQEALTHTGALSRFFWPSFNKQDRELHGCQGQKTMRSI